MQAATEKKKLVDCPLSFKKSTPGTHVLADSESGFQVYVARSYFAAAGIKPEGSKYHVTITVEEEA